MAYYITVGESTSINSLRRLVLRLISIIAVGKIEVSNLYKTFLGFSSLSIIKRTPLFFKKRWKDIVENNLARVTKKAIVIRLKGFIAL